MGPIPFLVCSIWMGAGIALFTAIQATIIASIGHRVRVYQTFAVLCVSVCGLLISTAQYYSATTLEQAAHALRWQISCVCLAVPCIYAFLGLHTGMKRLRALPAIGLYFFICLMINLNSPYSARFQTLERWPSLRLPWGETVPRFGGVVSPLAMPIALGVFGMNIWAFTRARLHRQRGERRAALCISVFAVAQAVALIWSMLIDRRIVNGFYVGGWAFLCIVLLMSINFAVDIRDRNRTIRRAATEWQLTFDSIRTPLLLTDMDGRVVRANRAAHKLTEEVETLSDAEPWRTAQELLSQIGERGIASAEATFKGHTWELTVAKFSTGEDDGKPRVDRRDCLAPAPPETRCIVALWDISNLVELQESLRKRERITAMGTLVAGVAHEVRNPLFGISAMIDAYDEELGTEDLRSFTETLRGEVQRLTTLMRELLDYGKPAALHLHIEHIGCVVMDAVAAFVARGANIVTEISETLPAVVLDRARLRQVFENLIENAVQHSPAGGNIAIRATTVEHAGRTWVECHVDDAGHGFNLGEISQVFEPFYSRREGGTGLGLSIVQRIVEEHAGKVWACNRPEGGGSVRVRLPVPEV